MINKKLNMEKAKRKKKKPPITGRRKTQEKLRNKKKSTHKAQDRKKQETRPRKSKVPSLTKRSLEPVLDSSTTNKLLQTNQAAAVQLSVATQKHYILAAKFNHIKRKFTYA